MKKTMNIKRLLSNIKLKELDPQREEAFQNRMLLLFSDQQFAKESVKKTFFYKWIPNMAVSIATIMVLCFGITIPITMTAQAKNLTRQVISKEFGQEKINNIYVNLFRNITMVDMVLKKVVVDLKSEKIVEIITPHPVDLSEEEIEKTKLILSKNRFVFFVCKQKILEENSQEYIYISVVEPLHINEKVSISLSDEYDSKLELMFNYYTTDEIVNIKGFEYPDTLNKEAYVEIKSETTVGYQVLLIVNLEKEKIKGTNVKKIVE